VLRRVLALPALPHVRYRLIAAGGLLVCMAHTWVDVSMHRWGTFGLMSLLLAAALKGRSDALPHPEGRAVPVVREDTRLPQGLIRAAGGVLVAFGVLAVLGGLWGLPATPEPLRARLQQRVQLALAAGQPEALQAAVGAGLSLYPLDAWFHFQQGQGALRLQGDLDGAVRAFERVNFLQPQHIYWALQQGLLYLPVSPGLAFAAWQRALGLPNFAPEATWRWLLNHTLDTPRYVPHLQRLAQVHSTFGVYYLKALPAGPLLHQALVQYLEYCPGLEAFTEQDKHTLLGRWSQSGGALACLDYLREHPGHVPQPWRYRALAYGALGFVQMACELVLEEVEPPHLLAHTRLRTPVALEEARRRFLLAPQDMLLAASLVEGYASEKSFDKCLSVIADFEPHAPWRHLPWGFYFYKGWALYTKGQYEAAWEALAQYVLHL
jgi:tetratricopeptide (TPR) repeat protein